MLFANLTDAQLRDDENNQHLKRLEAQMKDLNDKQQEATELEKEIDELQKKIDTDKHRDSLDQKYADQLKNLQDRLFKVNEDKSNLSTDLASSIDELNGRVSE